MIELPKKYIIYLTIILTLLATVLIGGSYLLVQGQSHYAVELMKCNGNFPADAEFNANFDSVESAKQYADDNLSGQYNIAYVIDSTMQNVNGHQGVIIWARSTVNCYSHSNQWFEPGPQYER